MVKQPGFVDPNQRKMLEKCNSIYLYFFGLSALAEGPMDSRSFVRAFVGPCVARYLEIPASDFSETWHKVASWRY